MTCKEKLIAEHPEWTEGDIYYCIHEVHCPSDFGYLDDPENEYGDKKCYSTKCTECWNREIPETVDEPRLSPDDITKLNEIVENTKEKENMSTTRKTKQELVEEIDALKKELENVKNVEQYEEGAYQIKALHTAFMNAGLRMLRLLS